MYGCAQPGIGACGIGGAAGRVTRRWGRLPRRARACGAQGLVRGASPAGAGPPHPVWPGDVRLCPAGYWRVWHRRRRRAGDAALGPPPTTRPGLWRPGPGPGRFPRWGRAAASGEARSRTAGPSQCWRLWHQWRRPAPGCLPAAVGGIAAPLCRLPAIRRRAVALESPHRVMPGYASPCPAGPRACGTGGRGCRAGPPRSALAASHAGRPTGRSAALVSAAERDVA